MALYSETADVLGEYEAAVGSLAANHFVDIEPVLAWGVTNSMVTQRPIWLRTANYGTEPAADDELFWLIGDTVTTPARENGVWLRGSGTFNRVLDRNDPATTIKRSFCGPATRITRDDTDGGGADLSWPFFELTGVGDRMSGFYLRGTYEKTNPYPEVAIEINKGSDVGTGKMCFEDMAITHFDRGIDINKAGGNNCDDIKIRRTGFHKVSTAIRTSSIQVIGLWIEEDVLCSDVDIMVDCVNGGMFHFDHLSVTDDDQIVLKVRNSNQNMGTFTFNDIKFDQQATSTVAVDMDTSSVNMYNNFIFWGGRDPRIISGGDHSATLGRFHGNCTVDVYGMTGVGDIVVSGGAFSGGNSDRVFSAPFINLVGCQFKSEETVKNPRLLLKTPAGEQAVEGRDYSGICWSGCTAHYTAGSALRLGQLIRPGNGGSNFAQGNSKYTG